MILCIEQAVPPLWWWVGYRASWKVYNGHAYREGSWCWLPAGRSDRSVGLRPWFLYVEASLHGCLVFPTVQKSCFKRGNSEWAFQEYKHTSNTLGVGSIMLPIKIPLLQSSKPVNMLSYIAKEMVHMWLSYSEVGELAWLIILMVLM